MNLGAENRKKTIAAGALGTVAVLCLGFLGYTLFGGDSAPTPPPSVAPVAGQTSVRQATTNAADTRAAVGAPAAASGPNAPGKPVLMPTGNAAGVNARTIARTSSSLDPTLDETAMLRTEHLVYSGTGRNVFSATYTPPPPPPEKPIAPPRPKPCPPNCPPPPPPPPPAPTCPPSCPPIPLKFFGVETHADGKREAFLLSGDDVFLAAPGDIVARRYKIGAINTNTVQIEDLTNHYTQTLPLQSS